MAIAAIPRFKNISNTEQFVPNDNGSCTRVPVGKVIKGSYFDYVDSKGVAVCPASKWSRVTDSSYDGDIIYENLGEKGNRLTFVPVPVADHSAGFTGEIAVDVNEDGTLNTIYICWGESGETATPRWVKSTGVTATF
jgi:hypothetical protein